MKKKILFILIICIVVIILIIPIIFIPAKIKIASIGYITQPLEAINRQVSNKSLFTHFNINDKNTFVVNNQPFQLLDIHFLGSDFTTSTQYKNIQLNGSVRFIFLKKDSVVLINECSFYKSNNPLVQYIQYFRALQFKKIQDKIVQELATLLSSSEFLYGVKIKHTLVQHDLYLSYNFNHNGIPSTELLYSKIDGLKKYILQQNGVILTPPMVNFSLLTNNRYRVMIAFATNVIIKESTDYKFKKMIKGNLLEAVVIGDNKKIKDAEENLHNYVFEKHLISPAVPYQILITNRIAEKDSTRWVTKLNFPIY